MSPAAASDFSKDAWDAFWSAPLFSRGLHPLVSLRQALQKPGLSQLLCPHPFSVCAANACCVNEPVMQLCTHKHGEHMRRYHLPVQKCLNGFSIGIYRRLPIGRFTFLAGVLARRLPIVGPRRGPRSQLGHEKRLNGQSDRGGKVRSGTRETNLNMPLHWTCLVLDTAK